MPGRHPKRDDPFHTINSWDDGFEYIQPGVNSPLSGSSAGGNYFSQPPQAAKPSRQPRYEEDPLPKPPLGRDSDPFSRPRRRSPGPLDDDLGRPRRHRREPSPPFNRFSRSPSPIRRHEDRPPRTAYYPPQAAQGRPRQPGLNPETSDPPMRRRSTREPPVRSLSTSPPPRHRRRAATYSRSPSPPPRRARGYETDPQMGYERDRRDRPYERDPRARGYDRDPRDRGYDRDLENRAYGRPERERDRDRRRTTSPPPAKSGGKSRPSISRTNSAKAKVAHLSPMWQKAALSALQAGGLAALQMRAEPGSWGGQKGAQVATAALGAAAADAFTKGGNKGGPKTRNGVEELGGALGGLIIDRFGKIQSGKKKDRSKY